jgi:hypothetical protein
MKYGVPSTSRKLAVDGWGITTTSAIVECYSIHKVSGGGDENGTPRSSSGGSLLASIYIFPVPACSIIKQCELLASHDKEPKLEGLLLSACVLMSSLAYHNSTARTVGKHLCKPSGILAYHTEAHNSL